MGGAKASTKVPVISHLLNCSEHVAVGGVIANDILKVRGRDVGTSRVDDYAVGLASSLDVNDTRLVIPTDFIEHEGAILDMGPQSAQVIADLCSTASLIVWNGPMGIFENPAYRAGTNTIAQAVAQSSATSVIGGGDTASAVRVCGLELSSFDFASTGGGAMLALLAGQRLPGLDVLGYRP
jgi:phosphoglycerate kinase